MPVLGEVRVDIEGIRRELAEKKTLRDSLDENIRALEATLDTILKFQIPQPNSLPETKSCESINSAGIAPQFTRMKGPSRRGERV